jgi:hypothetical protein
MAGYPASVEVGLPTQQDIFLGTPCARGAQRWYFLAPNLSREDFWAGFLGVRVMEFAKFDFEAMQWPAVRIVLQRAPVDDAEIEDFQVRFCGLLSLALTGGTDQTALPPKALRIMFLVDGIVEATMEQRLRAASVIQAAQPFVAQGAIAGTALVVTSALAREFLTFVLGMAPLQSRNDVFESEAEALSWLSALP